MDERVTHNIRQLGRWVSGQINWVTEWLLVVADGHVIRWYWWMMDVLLYGYEL